MIINTHELFSSAQRLSSIGDAVSRPVDIAYLGSLVDAERPFLHIQTAAAPPRLEGLSLLEVGLLHSDDRERFTWVISPVEGLEITRGKAWAIMPLRPPAGLKRFLMLRYRVTGDSLTAGALSAFLSANEAERPMRERRQNVTAQHDYYPSGFSFPPGYNRPGKY